MASKIRGWPPTRCEKAVEGIVVFDILQCAKIGFEQIVYF